MATLPYTAWLFRYTIPASTRCSMCFASHAALCGGYTRGFALTACAPGFSVTCIGSTFAGGSPTKALRKALLYVRITSSRSSSTHSVGNPFRAASSTACANALPRSCISSAGSMNICGPFATSSSVTSSVWSSSCPAPPWNSSFVKCTWVGETIRGGGVVLIGSPPLMLLTNSQN